MKTSTFFKKYISVFIIILFSVTIFIKCTPKNGEVDDRPNIVLIFTDELQFSDISAYGGSIPTPQIDKLAEEGMMFTQAYCPASMCTPSRFSILTGLYPGRCTAETFIASNPLDQPYNIAWNTWITPDIKSIATTLSENGYMTGMSGKWHIGHLPSSVEVPELAIDADLDDPEIDSKLKERQRTYENQVIKDAGFDYAASVVWQNFDSHPVRALRFHNFPWITRGALNFLDQQKEYEKPFMLFVTPTAIHGPNHVEDLDKDMAYTPEGKQTDLTKYNLDKDVLKKELAEVLEKIRHRYAGISNIDFQLGMIRAKLSEIGKADNTIIIFMSDHNIEPGKATSYEKGLHIPMIVFWPGVSQGAQQSSSLIASVDVYPTILEAAGIQPAESLKLDGYSFAEVLKNPDVQTRTYIFAENGFTRSVSDGKYKYIALRYPEALIESMENDVIDFAPSYVQNWPQAHSAIAMQSFPNYFDQNQLYDLESDPYEQENIYEQNAEVAEGLKKVLKQHLASFRHPFDLADVEYLASDDFKKKYETNLQYDLSNIPWLRRDHGNISWPPKN